jgi:hypothetical protein
LRFDKTNSCIELLVTRGGVARAAARGVRDRGPIRDTVRVRDIFKIRSKYYGPNKKKAQGSNLETSDRRQFMHLCSGHISVKTMAARFTGSTTTSGPER